MSADFERFAGALRDDTENVLLPDADALRSVGTRRTRRRRIGTTVATVAVLAVVIGAAGLFTSRHSADATPATSGPATTPTAPSSVSVTATPATSPTPKPSHPAVTPAKPSATHTSTGAPSAPSGGGGTTAPATTPACHVADLKLRSVIADSASGLIAYDIVLKNTSGHACDLPAEPHVSIVDPVGNKTVTLKNGNPFGGKHSTKTVRVHNGSTVQFSLNEADGLNVSPLPGNCSPTATTYHALILRLANGSLTLHVSVSFPCRYPQAGDWSLS